MFVPLSVRAEVALFWVRFVTLLPISALMVTPAVPLPLLMMAPVLFTAVPERTIKPPLAGNPLFWMVMSLPVPELVENPPVKFIFPVLVLVFEIVRSLLTVTAPAQ